MAGLFLSRRQGAVLSALGRAIVLILPTAILLGASMRAQDRNLVLWVGTVFQATVCFLSFFSRGTWRQPLGPSVITLYLIGLTWLWFGDPREDWFGHLAKSILLVVPMVF